MKRIIFALVTIVAALGLASFTTRAVWQDTVTVSNNQIQTSTADLQVSTTGIGGGSWDTSTKSSSLTLNGLYPGGTAVNDYTFSLLNNSSTGVNFNIAAQVTDVTGTTGVDESKLLLNLYENGTDPETGSNTSGWISLSNWKTSVRAMNSIVTSSNSKDYRLAAKLDSSADNSWQGKTVTLTFTVTGTQP